MKTISVFTFSFLIMGYEGMKENKMKPVIIFIWFLGIGCFTKTSVKEITKDRRKRKVEEEKTLRSEGVKKKKTRKK